VTEPPSPFAVTSPLVRASLVREQARLDALSEHHRRAFPLALAQLMVGVLLVLAAMSVLGRKPGWQHVSVQVVVVNAALVVASYVMLAPVRYAMADAVADVLEVHPPPMANTGDRATRRAELLATDLQLLLAQLAVYGFAAIALRRPQAAAYFAAIEARAALEAESDHDDA
jgi:hypothetical protein